MIEHVRRASRGWPGRILLYYTRNITKICAREDVMRDVKTLGLLGTGVIGGGWAVRALHFGIDVIAADVKPEMEAWLRGAVANAGAVGSRGQH
jgi:phosphoglycerate dehydrogenase-like enzyme